MAFSREMTELNSQIKQNEAEFLGMLDELAVTDDTKEIIEATKKIFEHGGTNGRA